MSHSWTWTETEIHWWNPCLKNFISQPQMFKNDKHSDLSNNLGIKLLWLFAFCCELLLHALFVMHRGCFYTNSEGRPTMHSARKPGLQMLPSDQVGHPPSDQIHMRCTRQSVYGTTSENMLGKKIYWRLILNSITLTFTFNKMYLKELFAMYSIKKLYERNFQTIQNTF